MDEAGDPGARFERPKARFLRVHIKVRLSRMSIILGFLSRFFYVGKVLFYEGLLMASHGQALEVVSFYYDIVSAAAHGRHMIFRCSVRCPPRCLREAV